MTKRVEMELQKLADEYKGREFAMEAWERIVARSGISFTTFKKYVKLEAHIYKAKKDSWEWEQGYDTYTEYSWK